MGEPDRVGRYILGARLGAGGMAEVYRARAPGLGLASQDVALKLMHRHLAQDTEFVRLFFREAQVASALQHVNVVNVVDSGEDDGVYYLAMELVDGPTLRALIRAHRQAPFDIAAAVAICCAVCDGLHHAHERTASDGTPLGIVHRDVSPGNVLLSWDGAIKISDFGVATATAAWTSLRSATGSIRGKIAYMAPEQARGNAVDQRADVFSVANMLFELIEGRRLLQASGEVELLHELVFAGFGDGRPTRRDCPTPVADALARALAVEPEDRFATAKAFATALRRACSPLDEEALRRYVRQFEGRVAVFESERKPDVDRSEVDEDRLEPRVPVETPAATVSLEVDVPAEASGRAGRPWLVLGGAVVGLVVAGVVVANATPLRTAAPTHWGRVWVDGPVAPPDDVNVVTESSGPVGPTPDQRERSRNETVQTPQPQPSPKRRRRRRGKPKAAAPMKPPPDESLFPL